MKRRYIAICLFIFGMLSDSLLAAHPESRQQLAALLADTSPASSQQLLDESDRWIALLFQEQQAEWQEQLRILIKKKWTAYDNKCRVHRRKHIKLPTPPNPAMLYVAACETLQQRIRILYRASRDNWPQR